MEEKETQTIHKPHYALIATFASVIIVSILITIKFYAYIESSSAAVLASLTDSVMDAAISIIMLIAVRYSLEPADDKHRYGHGNIESLAALFQAILLAIAAIFLLVKAYDKIVNPIELSDHIIASSIILISVILSVILVLIQKYCIKYSGSLAVEADKAHYSGDIFMNMAVILALIIDYYNGPHWIDPVFAAIIALILLNSARKIGTDAVNMILDCELPDKDRQKIISVIRDNKKILGFHDVRTRKSGMDIFVAFDIEVKKDITLKQAHDITVELEKDILKIFPQAQIMIHTDPEGEYCDLSRHNKVKI